MRTTRTVPKVVAALATGVGFVLVTAAPAQAYADPNWHGADYSQSIAAADDILTVCDEEADGNGVKGHYYLNNGAFYQQNDSTGSADPCGFADWQATPYWITRYKTYEDNVTSTQAWTYT